MAITLNKDTVIYNELAQTSYLERQQDNLEVFNGASNGAITLQNKIIRGDFSKSAFYKIGGEIQHRDVNSDSAAVSKKIGMGEAVGVKVPYKYGPYATTEEAFKRRAKTVEEFAMLIGQDFSDASIKGHLQYALAALDAAISSNDAMVVKGSIAKQGRKALTKAMRAYGDKFGNIALWVMNSATFFDIVDDAITEKIYGEIGFVIYGGLPGTLGIPILVTDLVQGDNAYGLQRGAITVTESQAPGIRLYDINEQENLGIGYRSEGTFNLELLGYSWADSAGANPDLAKISDKTSWTMHVADDKSTAGVKLELDDEGEDLGK